MLEDYRAAENSCSFLHGLPLLGFPAAYCKSNDRYLSSHTRKRSTDVIARLSPVSVAFLGQASRPMRIIYSYPSSSGVETDISLTYHLRHTATRMMITGILLRMIVNSSCSRDLTYASEMKFLHLSLNDGCFLS